MAALQLPLVGEMVLSKIMIQDFAVANSKNETTSDEGWIRDPFSDHFFTSRNLIIVTGLLDFSGTQESIFSYICHVR